MAKPQEGATTGGAGSSASTEPEQEEMEGGEQDGGHRVRRSPRGGQGGSPEKALKVESAGLAAGFRGR